MALDARVPIRQMLSAMNASLKQNPPKQNKQFPAVFAGAYNRYAAKSDWLDATGTGQQRFIEEFLSTGKYRRQTGEEGFALSLMDFWSGCGNELKPDTPTLRRLSVSNNATSLYPFFLAAVKKPIKYGNPPYYGLLKNIEEIALSRIIWTVMFSRLLPNGSWSPPAPRPNSVSIDNTLVKRS